MLAFGGDIVKIGIPTEIKSQEARVAATPALVDHLVDDGHQVLVQAGAGAGVGLTDEHYRSVGATVLPDAPSVFEAAEMILKVKEPQAVEIAMLRPDQLLFTYLHLAADRAQAEGLVASGCTAVAYETVVDDAGRLPLLTPMSQVAGRMAVDVGAYHLLQPAGGRGLLLGGAPGVAPANVLILGGGTSGKHAAQVAAGHGADVTLLDISASRLEQLDDLFRGQVKTIYSTPGAVRELIRDADLVIGCVLIPGAAAPKLVQRQDLATMKRGAVLVDVAIDQGGCFETSRPTTHDAPTYVVDGVVHYCVANMPGAAPLTSTYALEAATAPYVRAIARWGFDAAAARDPGLAEGLNVRGGRLVHPAVVATFPDLG